eukprot:7553835-Lingulodinium_polyedra.AAC.1
MARRRVTPRGICPFGDACGVTGAPRVVAAFCQRAPARLATRGAPWPAGLPQRFVCGVRPVRRRLRRFAACLRARARAGLRV